MGFLFQLLSILRTICVECVNKTPKYCVNLTLHSLISVYKTIFCNDLIVKRSNSNANFEPQINTIFLFTTYSKH